MALFFTGTSPKSLTFSEDHDHIFFEVILTLEGEGSSVIGGKEYSFSPGSIHIIPPNTIHRKWSAGGFRDIFFHTDTLYYGKESSLSQKAAHSPITLEDDADATMRQLMTLMYNRYMKFRSYDPVLESLYHAAIQQLNEWYETDRSDFVVEEIVHRLTASFNDPEFEITDALYATGYSKDYIRRRFCRSMGMTPSEYLIQLRLQYAKQLLQYQKELNLSISQIAANVGYYDVCYFSRIFRKKEGISPSEYADKFCR